MNDDISKRIERFAQRAQATAAMINIPAKMVKDALSLTIEIRAELAALEIEEAAVRGTFIAGLVNDDAKGLGSAEWKATHGYRASAGYVGRKVAIRRLELLIADLADIRHTALSMMREPSC